MRFAISVLLAATAIMASPGRLSDDLPVPVDGQPTTHTVWVGDRINPEEIRAAVGDKVEFRFHPGRQSVVQSKFDRPCAYKKGFTSSVVEDGRKVFVIEIKNEEPMWYYHGSRGLCHKKGIVGVINPPVAGTSDSNLFNYHKASLAKRTTHNCYEPSGGSLINI
ncbi:hypothetical protein CFIMG_007822RA00001 [Ceratocystis fimbriata CBS 114723]|uniref:Plastocyanin-like domain-containing protein n=1 Tax=Ceratocystis fimbriata CBS 114723 TaxID=1035309 RepID=A0A2C5WUM4_9PEZI|nr:hypothetical protein CFIMG_007822RA00001 [Ceratocystis fimbriata CBS 114723]